MFPLHTEDKVVWRNVQNSISVLAFRGHKIQKELLSCSLVAISVSLMYQLIVISYAVAHKKRGCSSQSWSVMMKECKVALIMLKTTNRIPFSKDLHNIMRWTRMVCASDSPRKRYSLRRTPVSTQMSVKHLYTTRRLATGRTGQ